MIKPHLPDLEADPVQFTEVVLGLEWINDAPTQTFIIDFLTQLKSARSSLILQSDYPTTTDYSNLPKQGYSP